MAGNVRSLQSYRSRFSKQLADELDATTAQFQELQARLNEMGGLVLETFINDLKNGRISGHNAANCYAGLLTSMAKVARLRLEIYNQLCGVTALIGDKPEEEGVTEEKRAMREVAEQLLMKIVRKKLADQEAAKKEAENSQLAHLSHRDAEFAVPGR